VTSPGRLLLALLLAAPVPLRAEAPTRPDAERPPEDPLSGVRVESLLRQGFLSLSRVQGDPDFPGRHHLRFDQRVRGVRVFGAQLVQQVDEGGATLSVSGTIDESLSLDVRPGLTADQVYFFVVTAVNADGESGESCEVTARINPATGGTC
jgi:hypothetical protein